MKNLWILCFAFSILLVEFSHAEVSMVESRCPQNDKQVRCLILKDSKTNKQYSLFPFKNSNLEYNKLKSEVKSILRGGPSLITYVFPQNSSVLKMGEASIRFTFLSGGSAQLDQSTMDLRYLTRKLQDCESRRGPLRAFGDAIGVTEDNCSRGSIVDSNRGSIDPKSRFRFENYGKELPTRYGSQPLVRSE